MPPAKVPYGKPVKLLIDFQGFPDGKPVQFQVWRKTSRGEDKVPPQLNGATKAGKAKAMWNPDFGVHNVELKESETGEKVEEKYYFTARIHDKEKVLEKKSEEMEFAFPLNINIKDKEGPLNDVQFTVTLSDGTKRKGKFSGGLAKLRDVPLGKFKVEVDWYSPRPLYGAVQRGTTTATGTVSKDVSYNVKLYIDKEALPADPTFSIERLDSSTGKFEEKIDGKEITSLNMLALKNKDLTVVITDNTADGDPIRGPSPLTRRRFYANNRLVNFLYVFVPLRMEVRKFEGQSTTPVNVTNDEVIAMFEIVDPPEDTANVKGPRPGAASPRTGKGFIENFIKTVTNGAGSGDDNCIRGFATRPFNGRCRRPGDTVAASDVLFRRRAGRRVPIPADPSDDKVGRTRIRAGEPVGTANLFFHPPPIFGDSYRFKITLNDAAGNAVLLRDDAGSECTDFQTSSITIWKRVEIHMVVRQEGVNYNIIKWDQVRKAYRDAFIDVKEPPPERRLEIPLNEWMGYLNRFVYGRGNSLRRNWRRALWRIYRREENVVDHITDFSDYSFPQEHDYIAAPGLTPTDDNDPNAWDLLGLLAQRAVRDRLGVPWRTFRSPFRGRRIGLCVLLCKPASESSGVGGRHEGGKLFYMVRTGDVTCTFIHEMGHALFLRHGATSVVRATQNPSARPLRADAPFVVRTEAGGEEGPFLDDHYSEDMIACVMSYNNDYYGDGGNILADTDHPSHFDTADHPTDWHFCGVCLLLLRLYDRGSMLRAANDSFRKLQYFQKPTIAAIGGNSVTTESGTVIRNIQFPNSLTIRRGRRQPLFILYPQEGVIDNSGRDPYKDLCHLARSRIIGGQRRGRWTSTNRTVADVRVIRRGNIWVSFLRGRRRGNAAIAFEIHYGPAAGDVVTSDPVNVRVQ